MNPSDADPVNPDEPPALPVDGAADAPAVKPRRRRAPVKVAVADAADAAPAAGAAVGGEFAPGAAAFEARVTPAPAPSAEPAWSHDAIESRAESVIPHDAGEGGEALVVAAEGALPAGEERSGRRARHRRRGRRGGERARDGEAGADSGPPGASRDGADDAEARAEPLLAGPELPRESPADPAEVFAEVLSGAFDFEPEAGAPLDGSAEAAAPPRRVLAAEPDAPKLQKVLAQSGVGSRRDLEQMIVEGRITVNGEPAHTGQRISFGDRIQVDGKPVRYRIAPPPPRVLAYHKPAGEVVTHDDPQQRPTVFRRLPRL
jgi:23S rRNA pseudouridine2605 synthase